MAFQRRQLLRFTGTGLLLTAMPGLASGTTASHLHSHRIYDDVAVPGFRCGDVFVVDSACIGFDGTGLYLYPAWGRPRPYLVTAGPAGMLAFSNPGTGKLLWMQSQAMDPVFAGKVLDQPVMSGRRAPTLRPLQLPVLPPVSSLAPV